VLVVAGVDQRGEDGERQEGEDDGDHQEMVATFPLRSLSPSEKVHKTAAEYRRARGVCPRMPMWPWTMTLIAKRIERETEEARRAAAAEPRPVEPRARRFRR
jgi:hypothetical protein